MPIIQSAIKKMRRDQKKAVHNAKIRKATREAVKAMRNKPSKKALKQVFSQLDTAAKTNIIHKNKASRLKSRLSKLISK